MFISALKDVFIQKIETEPNLRSTLSSAELDSLIRLHLSSNGIESPYEYAVSFPESDSVWTEYASNASLAPSAFDYSFPIFNQTPNGPLLLLDFPEKSNFLIRQMAVVLLIVGVFSLLILSTFVLTIYHILRQKQLNDIKSDFINNMTHEFKTPLATISLAVDSIRHPNVNRVPSEVDRLSRIIEEENRRMHGHVERILQLAKMESGHLVIKKELFNLNEMLEEVVESMRLQVSSRKGILETDLDKSVQSLFGDRSHLYNALVNLLDNAMKYCERAPQIVVKSKLHDNRVCVEVRDNGIGMTKEAQRKVTGYILQSAKRERAQCQRIWTWLELCSRDRSTARWRIVH